MTSTPSPLLAGADLGTSGLKLLLVDVDGHTAATARADYPTARPPLADGSAGLEQDPQHWWEALRRALAETGLAERVVALGLTGQMQDLVLVDATGPLRPAILYADQRAVAARRRLDAQLPGWRRRTGNRQDTSSVAAKLAWLVEHEPTTTAAAEAVLFGPAGYIAWRLGADPACDATTASTTGLLDVAARRWWEPAAEAAGVDGRLLPRLLGSPAAEGPVARLSARHAAQLGLPQGIPVALGFGDAAATTDGLVGSAPGDAYAYLGTTGWIAAVDSAVGSNPEATAEEAGESAPHQLAMGAQSRLRIAAVQSAGSTAEWSREHLLGGMAHAEAEARAARRLENLRDRPLSLPGLAGERYPVRDTVARGGFIGLTESTEALDLHLSVLTGLAYALGHGVEELGLVQDTLPVVGGAAQSPVQRQLLADATGMTVRHRPGSADAAASHAARAAADAAGLEHQVLPHFSRSVETPTDTAAESEVTEPSALAEEHARLRRIHRGLYEALAPSFAELADG